MTKRRYTWDDIVYMVVYNFVIVFIAVITLYPIIFVVSASISDPIEVGKGTVILLPKGINFTSYIHLIGTEDVWVGYRNTLIYTVLLPVCSVRLRLLILYPKNTWWVADFLSL